MGTRDVFVLLLKVANLSYKFEVNYEFKPTIFWDVAQPHWLTVSSSVGLVHQLHIPEEGILPLHRC
jgi:hypothetical protein